ncbi:MAG: toll/interleukin-1 receptor domain-containing protein, partial [Nitrospirota bacterium]
PRHVFLSYAREDMASADRLKKALEAEGLSVWIDREGIQSGSWKDRVMEGLNRSRAVVLLLTKDSLNSDTVKKELSFAARKNVPIIPVHSGGIKEDQLPDWYTLDYGDLQQHLLNTKNYGVSVKKLSSAVKKLRKKSRTVGQP